ncbi:MAG: hypothetical protein KDA84_09710 [Planctomycetaceae bacterium]|nr:hypothetical protein [Planctomycetaceae bacterium]
MKPRPKYCKQCGREVSHRKKRMKTTTGLMLTVLTAGLFLPVWLLSGRWVCMECGTTKR